MRQITDGDYFELACGQMRARLLTPWSAAYGRTRFDHMGFIPEIWYNGYCYSQREQLSPPKKSSGGSGICFEFKSGFTEKAAAPGDRYLKLGIGPVIRSETDWSILDEARTEGMPSRVCTDGNSAVFHCESPVINGFGYSETKTVALDINSITVRTQLVNTGCRDLEISEYSHNFFSLRRRPIDNTTRLELPCVLDPKGNVGHPGLIWNDGGLGWVQTPQESVSQMFSGVKEAVPYAWRLSASDTDASVTEEIDFLPEHAYVWSRSYCVCAEIFFFRLLKPGESTAWQRKWLFT